MRKRLKGDSPTALNDIISRYGDPDMIPLSKEDQANAYEMARPKLNPNIKPIGKLVFFGTGGQLSKQSSKDWEDLWNKELTK